MHRSELAALGSAYLIGRVRRGEITTDTAANHRCALDILYQAHGQRSLDRLGRATIHRWLEARSHLKAATRRTQWSYVTTFLDHLADSGQIRVNPCHGMKAPRRPRSVPRALPRDQVTATLAHAPDARGRAIVMLMVELGLRCIEVNRLNVEDWSRRDQLIRVTGKGGHVREVPVTLEAARALDAYLSEHPATSGPLIRSYKQPHRPLRYNTLSHYVSAWMSAAGIKRCAHDGISAHALRHTAASDVLDECNDVRVVQAMLGHLHLSSTSVYLRRADIPQMRRAMAGRGYRGVA